MQDFRLRSRCGPRGSWQCLEMLIQHSSSCRAGKIQLPAQLCWPWWLQDSLAMLLSSLQGAQRALRCCTEYFMCCSEVLGVDFELKSDHCCWLSGLSGLLQPYPTQDCGIEEQFILISKVTAGHDTLCLPHRAKVPRCSRDKALQRVLLGRSLPLL